MSIMKSVWGVCAFPSRNNIMLSAAVSVVFVGSNCLGAIDDCNSCCEPVCMTNFKFQGSAHRV